MATRARIGAQNDDGSVTSIYSHWDDYPDHVGPILNEHYCDPEKIAALLELGDLSILRPELGAASEMSRAIGDDVWLDLCDRASESAWDVVVSQEATP